MDTDTRIVFAKCIEQYLKNNPLKTKDDWDLLSIEEQDVYLTPEMDKVGLVRGDYLGRGAYQWVKKSSLKTNEDKNNNIEIPPYKGPMI